MDWLGGKKSATVTEEALGLGRHGKAASDPKTKAMTSAKKSRGAVLLTGLLTARLASRQSLKFL